MNKTIVSGIVAACGALCLLGFRAQDAPDLSSPKAAVRSLVSAVSRHDVKAMAQCVKNAADPADIEKLFNGEATRFPEFEVKDLIAESTDSTARVAAEVTFRYPTGGPNQQMVNFNAAEIFVLEKQGDNWLVVPDAALLEVLAHPQGMNGNGMQIGMRPLGTVVAMVGANKEMNQALQGAREQALATSCLSNVKQIALGALMYTQDYDEIYPRKSASYVDLIMPYIKNRAIFSCPKDVKGNISYTFNANLQGARMASIAAPALTVLVYEGKNGQLEFRHAGRAVVGFADGHAKLMSAEGAKTLYWYPAGVKPGPVPAQPAKKGTNKHPK